MIAKVQEQLMRGQLVLGVWQEALETGIAISAAYK